MHASYILIPPRASRHGGIRLLYEWRVYHVVPGRMGALNERFEKITTKLFEKHGIKIVGFWEAVFGTSNTLYYMLAFKDMAHKESAWNAFITDPDWIKARQETEARAGGPLVERVDNLLLKPTAYSPLK
jgi:hypothetical protein